MDTGVKAADDGRLIWIPTPMGVQVRVMEPPYFAISLPLELLREMVAATEDMIDWMATYSTPSAEGG